MKKSVNIDGETKKVNFEMVVSAPFNRTKVTRFGHENLESLVTIFIDEVEHKHSFVQFLNVNPKNHKVCFTYECQTTGKRFGDSHKKLIEHLLCTSK